MSPVELMDCAVQADATTSQSSTSPAALHCRVDARWRLGGTGELVCSAELHDDGRATLEVTSRITDVRVLATAQRSAMKVNGSGPTAPAPRAHQHAVFTGSWSVSELPSNTSTGREWRIDVRSALGALHMQVVERGAGSDVLLLTNLPEHVGLLGGTYALTSATLRASREQHVRD